MDVFTFGLEVIAVSASGALAPGPLFFTNLLYGARQGIAGGLKIASGHAAVELPLIIVLSIGLFASTESTREQTDLLGLIGGFAILGFAGLQIANVLKKNMSIRPSIESRKGPFIAGVFMSVFNPLFIIWWLSVGPKLLADSASFGLIPGGAILFGFHIWIDYGWLAATAYLAHRGRSVLKSKYYPLFLLSLTAVLVYYGVSFIVTGVT